MMDCVNNIKFDVDEELLKYAVAKTKARFGTGLDNWMKAEELFCKMLCGPEYSHLEEGMFRVQATSMRKAGKLKNAGDNTDDVEDKVSAEPELSQEYKDYLKSSAHLQLVRIVIMTAEFKCQVCGKQEAVECHHRKYDRLKQPEEIKDMIATCRKCHNQLDKRRREEAR